MKKKTKKNLGIIAIVLVMVTMVGMIANLYGAFDEKAVNPENIINVDATGYVASGKHNNGHGLNYDVEKLGEIKVSGRAKGNDTFTVIPELTLTAGTYKFESGLKKWSYDNCLRLKDSNGSFIYADADETVTLTAGTYELQIFIADEEIVYETFRPVLVASTAGADFYK